MIEEIVDIRWPNGKVSRSIVGSDWLEEACKVGLDIPTGCLTGSCGACEIEVNGNIIRACIDTVSCNSSKELNVEFSYDPFW